MAEELIPIFGILFGIGGPAVIVIVWFTLNYHKRRKLMELHHAERMAAIERGMEIPPLPIELLDGRSTPKRRRTALLPGLAPANVTVAAGAPGSVVVSANYAYLPIFPWLPLFQFGSLGTAHTLSAAVTMRAL